MALRHTLVFALILVCLIALISCNGSTDEPGGDETTTKKGKGTATNNPVSALTILGIPLLVMICYKCFQ